MSNLIGDFRLTLLQLCLFFHVRRLTVGNFVRFVYLKVFSLGGLVPFEHQTREGGSWAEDFNSIGGVCGE